MSFEQPLKITTIDERDTRRREDGFCLKDGTIYLATVAPDFEQAFFDEVKACFYGGIFREGNVYLFPREIRGFSQNKEERALVVRLPFPYKQAQVSLGKAIIDQQLTYEDAELLLDMGTDRNLNKICRYAQNEIGERLNSREVVMHLGFVTKGAYTSALRLKNLPYIGYDRLHRTVSLSKGFPPISNPLRNPIALVNCCQLVTFLETGQAHFSRQELEELISGTAR